MGGYISNERFECIRRASDVDGRFLEKLLDEAVTRVQVDLMAMRYLTKDTWRKLEKHVFSVRPLMLRLYGGTPADLSFLRLVPSLRRLALEAGALRNVEAIADIGQLSDLSLVLRDRSSHELLKHVQPNVEQLALMPDNPKAAPRDCDLLLRFPHLLGLHVKYCARGLDALLDGQARLEELTVMAMGLPNVDAIGRRTRLRKLALKACTVRSLDALAKAKEVRFLQLWKATNANLDVLGDMPGLQSLYLQTVNNVSAFPRLRRAKKLGRIVLYAVQRMRDFKSLGTTGSLRELACYQMKDQEPEDFLPILRNPSVEVVTLHSAKTAVRTKAEALVAKYGKGARRISFMRDDYAYVD